MELTDEIGDDQINNNSIDDVNGDKNEEESIAPMEPVMFPQKVAFSQKPTEGRQHRRGINEQR